MVGLIFFESLFAASLAPQGAPKTKQGLPSSQTASSRQVRIAVIKPIFTTTAYSSFYRFYREYASTQAGKLVHVNLDLLNATIVDGWGYSFGLYSFVTSSVARRAGVIAGNNMLILTDISVHDGKLFDSSTGARRFDVVVLGFTEYVTAREYSNLEHFVARGGKIIFLAACNFLAEVRYSPTANKLALVEGHGWMFNGSAAWKGPYHRWYAENSNWVGSEYALFYTGGYHINGAVANTSHPLSVLLRNSFGQHIFVSYRAHEENIITNSTDRVIAYWQVSNLRHPSWIVAAYEHGYQKGMVIHSGVFGTDIIATDIQFQYFIIGSIFLTSSNSQSPQIDVVTNAPATSLTAPVSTPPPDFSRSSTSLHSGVSLSLIFPGLGIAILTATMLVYVRAASRDSQR